MKYGLIVDNIVIQVSTKRENGYIGIPDNVCAGMISNDDGTYSLPLKSIDELRSAKKSELRSTCESKINAGFIADVLFPDCNYRNDRDQQNNIRDCALGDGGYIWMNEDFTHHTKTQAQSIYALSRSEVQSHKLKYANKCEYLNDPSRTAREIEAVTWNSVE